MSLISRVFGKQVRAEKGKTYEVGNAGEFNGAAYFGGKVETGERLVCLSVKSKEWPYPTFKRENGITQDAPHGTRETITMTYRAKGSPASYGLKACAS